MSVPPPAARQREPEVTSVPSHACVPGQDGPHWTAAASASAGSGRHWEPPPHSVGARGSASPGVGVGEPPRGLRKNVPLHPGAAPRKAGGNGSQS